MSCWPSDWPVTDASIRKLTGTCTSDLSRIARPYASSSSYPHAPRQHEKTHLHALLVWEGKRRRVILVPSRCLLFDTMATRLGCGTKVPAVPCLRQMSRALSARPSSLCPRLCNRCSPRSLPATSDCALTWLGSETGIVASGDPSTLLKRGKLRHFLTCRARNPLCRVARTAGWLRLWFRCMV
ncbi:hypothetical protein N658DRAFT_106367 [Parathielavia hyrcaniae]|uniref:Uncharacterized protein n=1 Tax=Parathielavia hyrcaniae TaxID=113614 RepID=A0AAN6T0Z7_9PEZI|nr:hypothetical protein N658DRAFT_106367 [Parathielavia hyrcaniae]